MAKPPSGRRGERFLQGWWGACDKPGYSVAGIFALVEWEYEIKRSDLETPCLPRIPLCWKTVPLPAQRSRKQPRGGGGWKKRLSWDEGRDMIVRGRDEKRCVEGERNGVQKR